MRTTRRLPPQPDLVVVTDPTIISSRGIEAPPLLVVEVLSPSSIKHDRQVKARRYAFWVSRTTGSSIPMLAAWSASR